MTIADIHDEAVQSLAKSKLMVKKLSAVCPDWTANEMLRLDFENLEESLAEFGKHQLGIRDRADSSWPISDSAD